MRLIPVAYLASYLLSVLGNSIASIALPLIVLESTGSALGLGAVAAATAIPAVIAGLLMGVVIDRINRRTSSVVADLISAASVAALPAIDLLSGLSLGWFVLFGVIGSLGDVPGLTARDALIPAIVRHGRIGAERLLGAREALGAVALILGPAAAGTLMAMLDASTVLWITAGTSLAAALLTLLIPHRVGEIVTTDGLPATAPGTAWAQLKGGWRAVFADRFLLTTTTLSVVSVTALAALQGAILPVYFTLVEQPGMLGLVLTTLAAGMLGGGTMYAVAGARVRRRTWFLMALLGSALGFCLIAVLSSLPVVVGGAFVLGASSGLLGALLGVLTMERVPEAMRGRIAGTQHAIMTGAAPVGIVTGSLVTEYTTVHLAALAVGVASLVPIVLGWSARSLRNLEPEPAGEDKRAVVSRA